MISLSLSLSLSLVHTHTESFKRSTFARVFSQLQGVHYGLQTGQGHKESLKEIKLATHWSQQVSNVQK